MGRCVGSTLPDGYCRTGRLIKEIVRLSWDGGLPRGLKGGDSVDDQLKVIPFSLKVQLLRR